MAGIFQNAHAQNCVCPQCHPDEAPKTGNFPAKNNHIMDEILMQDWLTSVREEGLPTMPDSPLGADWMFSKDQAP